MTDPAQDVRDWLEAERRTQGWLADQVGVHVAALRGWLSGQYSPRPKHARRLEDVTGVPAGSWLVARLERELAEAREVL